jgi:hypothetical protein
LDEKIDFPFWKSRKSDFQRFPKSKNRFFQEHHKSHGTQQTSVRKVSIAHCKCLDSHQSTLEEESASKTVNRRVSSSFV